MLGIRQEAGSAGWRKAVIAPALADALPWARGHMETPRGKISVSYQVWEGRLTAQITVPEGMEARLLWRGKEAMLHSGCNQAAL